MTTYQVTRKSDGETVYRYSAPDPIEWAGLEFATHDHTPEANMISASAPPSPLVLQPIEFLRRFKPAERMFIRALAKTDPIVEDFMALLDLTDLIHTNDADVGRGLGYLTMVGALAPGRRAEILGAA